MAKDSAAAVAAMRNAMLPQIDAALESFMDAMDASMQAASLAETERCISLVEGCVMKDNPIGPLFGAGWNEAIAFAAKQLRAWKDRTAEPNSATPPKEGDAE